ncbi:hypothetical protein KPG66_12610 [Mycetohabitans sp. B2]|uniref:hypothetical protein n=1 Tax=Mycetohabitans sp. B2 TaxID=2841274 RepID=UPI001F1CE7E8|nr:hypothetical protein [Mycetohabitans sp. B2]MCF7696901.1 hypothetical protein [Mycetohabitans sp. B2]
MITSVLPSRGAFGRLCRRTHAAPDLLGYGRYQDVAFDAILLDGQVEHQRTFVHTQWPAWHEMLLVALADASSNLLV